MTLRARFETALTQIETDSDKLHDIVHGDQNTVVTTEGGPVDSAAKAIKDMVDDINQEGEGWYNGAKAEADRAELEAQNAATSEANAYTHAQSAGSAVAYQDLAAIVEEVNSSVNVVDVFVYDTSKDSDGGAWRYRTQHASWYNETLDTTYRGSTKEFPAIALLVADMVAGTVTIYDLTDPGVPMWFVVRAGYHMWDVSSTSNSLSLAAKNGMILIGHSHSNPGFSGNGLYILDFAKDQVIADAKASSGDKLIGTSNRLETTYTSVNNSDGVRVHELVDYSINGLDVTVLPNAAIDHETLLPVPTIAVATEAGFSIINDDDSVVDVTSDTWRNISFSKTIEGIYVENGTVKFGPIPSADTTTASWVVFTVTTTIPAFIGIASSGAGVLAMPFGFARGYSVNLDLVHINYNDITKSMIAYITNAYNTGWLPGDIRRCFLADTVASNLIGSGEFFTNGDFSTNDLTGWDDDSIGTGTADASTGKAVITATDASNRGQISQEITCAVNDLVLFSFVVSGANSAFITITNTSPLLGANFAAGEHRFFTKATATSVDFIAAVAGNNGTTEVDLVSAGIGDADRSIKKSGLIVHGTINRTAVATGADLVAYSGFSATNYLEEPYSSALDFGTTDLCVIVWAKLDVTSGFKALVSKGDPALNNGGFVINHAASGPYSEFRVYTDTGESKTATGPLFIAGKWHFLVGTVENSIPKYYFDGELVGQGVAITGAMDSNVNLFVGNREDLTAPFANGHLSLLRITKTLPTPEQIKLIYNSEKALFSSGAKCVLDGDSSNVQALAYDETTGILHAGTDDYRSGFRGLVRVESEAGDFLSLSSDNGIVMSGEG